MNPIRLGINTHAAEHYMNTNTRLCDVLVAMNVKKG